MASVWCAQDVVLGRRVAIKVLAEQFLGDRGAVLRFKREARAAARLSGHPHVVTIFDVGETAPDGSGDPGRPFIVMECLAGGTVADALKVGEFSREETIRWLHEAAAALDFAHGRGIIHRDIKPANLLLDGARVLHVGDFGIARVGTEDTITSGGELFGTAAYLSPEQALGRPATEASDRYALAVVAYELLVGARPFSGANFAVQARQHVEQDPPRASAHEPSLPRAVDKVLQRGMAKQPEERWSSASEFAQAVEDALEESALVTRPLTPAGTHSERASAAALGAAGAASAAEAQPALAPLLNPGSTARRRSHPRAIAFGALAAAVVALAVAIIAGAGGPSHPSGVTQAASTQRAHTSAARNRTRPAPKPQHAAAPATTTSTAASTTQTSTASSNPPPLSADALEARGHSLLMSGNAAAAVGVLRQAVAAASPSSLTYAYALYDLGASLLQSGDPRAAAVVLQRRLQIPNQTEVVRQELQSALRQIGAQVNSSGGAAPGPGGPPGHLPGHGHGRGHGGRGNASD